MTLTLNNLVPDPVMSSAAVSLMNGGPFVADQIFPIVGATQDKFRYFVWDQADATDDVDTIQAFGDGANEVKMGLTYKDDVTQRYGLKMKLSRDLVKQAPNPAAVDNRRIQVILNRLRVGIEKRVRAKLLASSYSASPTTKWNAAGATIKKNIDAYKKAFRSKAGILPNTILLEYAVADVIANDTDILNRQKAPLNELLLSGALPKQIFDMNLVIGGAMAKDNPVAELSDIWGGKGGWLLYVDPSIASGAEVLTAGAQYRAPAWDNGLAVAARSWPDPDQSSNSDWYAGQINQKEHVISDTCIFYMEDLIS